MLSKDDFNKKKNPTSESYLIEVNTLKSFLKKEFCEEKNEIKPLFLPCPEVKRLEITKKSTGRKKDNASWFLSRQLDMFGESPNTTQTVNYHGYEVEFLSTDKDGGMFFINGEAITSSSTRIIKNDIGKSFVVVSELMLKDVAPFIFDKIKQKIIKPDNENFLIAKTMLGSDLVKLLDPSTPPLTEDLFVMAEFDKKERRNINVLVKTNMVNSALKKLSDKKKYVSDYMSCDDMGSGANNVITFHMHDNEVLFLPFYFKRNSALFAISSSILHFIETGNPDYLRKLSKEIIGKPPLNVDLCY